MFNQPAAWNKYIKTIIGTFEEQCVIPEAKAQAPAWKACLVPVCFFPLLILTIKCNLVTLESSYSNTAPNQEFGACAFAVSPRHQTWDLEKGSSNCHETMRNSQNIKMVAIWGAHSGVSHCNSKRLFKLPRSRVCHRFEGGRYPQVLIFKQTKTWAPDGSNGTYIQANTHIYRQIRLFKFFIPYRHSCITDNGPK